MTSKDRWLLPEGVDELLPQRAAIAEQMRRDVLDLFKVWGYQFVMPPLIEFTDSLLIGLGDDIANHCFRLTDQVSGKPLAVRADITSQTARIDAHSMRSQGVNRLCYAGSVLHALPKSMGASRCPIQAGAEIYGEHGISADIEIISLMLSTLQQVDESFSVSAQEDKKALHRLTLDIGHVGIYKAIAGQIQQGCDGMQSEQLDLILDAVQRKSIPDLKVLIPEVISDQALADILYEWPTLCGGVEVLERGRALLSGFGESVEAAFVQLEQMAKIVAERFPDVCIYLDLAELRGFDYHTGLVFAAYSDGCGSSLANGGRYDDVGEVFGAARPATGFNTDIKSLIDLVYGAESASKALWQSENASQVVAAPDHGDSNLWRAIKQLRASGEIVITVDEKELSRYQRQLVLHSKQWVVKE